MGALEMSARDKWLFVVVDSGLAPERVYERPNKVREGVFFSTPEEAQAYVPHVKPMRTDINVAVAPTAMQYRQRVEHTVGDDEPSFSDLSRGAKKRRLRAADK